ncbi:MAG: hypothetical protein J6S44_03945, partial [Clostridia bacterium]|nr:hypothetical protein [Clostridia bacterium]
GYVNELVSKIQTMRKDSGFEVTDRICVTLGGNAKLAAILEKNKDEVSRIVLADEILCVEADENGKSWSINDEKATISLQKSK